jgi:ABC-type sugar transport system ATPase subunit
MHIVAESAEAQVGSLSGGNQQKVMLARSLAGGANILLLDEPTAGVDAFTRGEIYRLIRAAVANDGCALVASSDIEEVLTLGQTVYVLQAGRIVQRLGALEASRESVLAAMGGR